MENLGAWAGCRPGRPVASEACLANPVITRCRLVCRPEQGVKGLISSAVAHPSSIVSGSEAVALLLQQQRSV